VIDGVTMEPDNFFELYERCIDLADRVPDIHRAKLMEIAERLLECAEESLGKEPAQNAPTTLALQ
jgi:hypothetical protein